MIYVLARSLARAGVAFSLFHLLPKLVRFDDVGLGGRLKPHKAKRDCNDPSMHFGKWALGFLALVQIAGAAALCRFGARRGIRAVSDQSVSYPQALK
jgi:hypothetical protein